MIGGKMIIEMKINGLSVPMIFDTGGKNSISSELKEALHLKVSSSREIMDANSNKSKYDFVLADSLETTDGKIAFKNVPILVLDNEIFTCFGGAKGLIGNDLFPGKTIEIDDKNKVIILTNGGKLASINRQMVPFMEDANGEPIIPLNIGKYHAIKVLFDTGAPDFLSLKYGDYKALLAENVISVLRTGESMGAMGASGRGKSGKRILTEMPEVLIGKKQFLNVRTHPGTVPVTLLGSTVIQYGKITIDFVNKLFLFVPYDNAVVDEKKGLWDLEMMVEGNDMVVSAIWDNLKGQVALNDKITHINGQEIKPMGFCESIVTGLTVLKGKTQAVLTVQTQNGTKKITIKKS